MTQLVTDIDALADEAEKLMEEDAPRCFLAIVGAPGSGKSTVANALHTRLDQRHPGKVAVLPMDGFHYDDAVLHQMQRRPWKGAPDTFDVGGLHSVLRRLADPAEGAVAVPVFDRDLEISRGSARIISPGCQLILIEGNYLLLDEQPWAGLADCFDLTVMIAVAEEELRRRLRARWTGYGLSEADILHKLDGNDLPNGHKVIHHSAKPDIVYQQ